MTRLAPRAERTTRIAQAPDRQTAPRSRRPQHHRTLEANVG